MNIINALAAVLLTLTAVTAFAETPVEAKIKKKVAAGFSEGTGVVSIIKTPYSGLYEIRTTNGDILYTDKEANYMFIGRIINTTTFEDHTKARVDEISKIKFNDLPFDLSIKMVKGDGKRVIAIFEDPNCGYCKRLRHSLQKMDNITVYSFLYNILGEDSVAKGKNIWCASDRLKAWDDWMLNNKEAPVAAAGCTTDPHEKVSALGRKLKITGTPAIFFADGTRVPGAISEQEIEKKLASLK